MRKILLLATGLSFVSLTFGQLIDVEFEVFKVHDDTEYIENDQTVTLDGYTTYRLYANLTNTTDFVSSVSGDINNNLRIGSIGDCDEDEVFFQHPQANSSPVGPLNDAFFEFVPTMEYDSHLTLGWHNESEFAGSQSIGAVQDNESPWIDAFNSGQPFEMNSNIGGAWFTILGENSQYAFAGDDFRVCLGQFTSKCELEFLGCVQVFVEGVQPTEGDGTECGVYACSSDGCIPGCTDPNATNYDATATADDGSCIYECALVIESAEVTNISCGGFASGEIEIITSGGQGQVLHSEMCGQSGISNNTLSNLTAGDYNICVTDVQGCMDSMMVTVMESAPIETTLAGITFPTCNGGTDGEICLDITGGNGGPFFTSNQNDPATAVQGNCAFGYAAGSNVVYVWEDLDCPAFITQAFTITEPESPVLNANDFADASCANISDGEIALLGQVGAAPYDFTLMIGTDVISTVTLTADSIIGGLPCGNYTVSMTDANGCAAEIVDNVAVECPEAIEINLLDQVIDISCPGDSDGQISVAGTGGNGTFLYNLGLTQAEAEAGSFDNTTGEFEDLAANSYFIAAVSENCVGSAEFIVGAPDPITYDLVVTDESEEGAEDGSVCVENISGGTGNVSWFWNDFSTEDCIEGLSDGDEITIQLEDENGCVTESTDMITLGISDLRNNISISLFPNPTSGVINVNAIGLNGQKVSAIITNTLGATVQAEEFGNLSGEWNKELNISDKADGVYFLTIQVGQDEVTYRVIKN